MRGQAKSQPEFLTPLSPETVVPPEHPLRTIKRRVDRVLKEMNPLFNRMYAEEGRPSIPPERLLKAKLLMPSTARAAKHCFANSSDTICCIGGFWIWT
jgi:transposase